MDDRSCRSATPGGCVQARLRATQPDVTHTRKASFLKLALVSLMRSTAGRTPFPLREKIGVTTCKVRIEVQALFLDVDRSSELFLVSTVKEWADGAPEGSFAQGRAATKVVRSLFLTTRERSMIRTLKTLAAAGLLASAATMASAATGSFGQVPDGVTNNLVQVHGSHRSCERGGGGWHRHNRFGERRACREWRGEGRRPDSCVRFGRAWFCDY